jgi:Ca2+:H+ antiporter
MAVIGVFSPTIFQMIYGATEMHCRPCHHTQDPSCQTCRFITPHPTKDPVYMQRTKPFMYLCVIILVLTYAIGLWFTLRTHTDKIYAPSKKSSKKKKRKQLLRFFRPHPESSNNQSVPVVDSSPSLPNLAQSK